MRYILILLILASQCKVFSQEVEDTIFIQKKTGNNIFIDSNKESSFYHEIIESFKSFPNLEFKKNKLNSNWIPIYKYKGKYFVYKSCDCLNPIIKLSDKKTLFNCFELSEYKNYSVKKINSSNFKISYRNFNGSVSKIKISYIDILKGIAKFEFENDKKEVSYLLMIELNKIKNFPIIVNDCVSGRNKELQFDSIDFKNLLKNK